MYDTTGRVLRLLTLLTTRAVWSGPEIAAALDVTTRTVRRDVDRLKDLGYPVHAGPGGYRLGPGTRLPPLMLADDEAVAVAVSLGVGAGGSVAGVEEAAMRTLSKLDQVLPARLRSEVGALQDTMATMPAGRSSAVDPDALMAFARAARDSVRVRFGYVDRDGVASERHAEPYRLLAAGRRWYLLAYDLDRDDWRLFRLDRVGELPHVTTFRFRPREAPDPAAYLQQSRGPDTYRHTARVRFSVPAATLGKRIPRAYGRVTAIDDAHCELEAGADDLVSLAMHLAWAAVDLDAELEVVSPSTLKEELRSLGDRMVRWSVSE